MSAAAQFARQLASVEAVPSPVASLIAQHRATLDRAEAATDFPSTLAMIADYRRKVAHYERHPMNALGMLGENGHAPGIRDVLKSALFHGKPWRSEAEMHFPDIRRAMVDDAVRELVS